MIVLFQNFFPLVNVIAVQNLLAPKLTLPRVWLRRKRDCCLDGSAHPWSGGKTAYNNLLKQYLAPEFVTNIVNAPCTDAPRELWAQWDMDSWGDNLIQQQLLQGIIGVNWC